MCHRLAFRVNGGGVSVVNKVEIFDELIERYGDKLGVRMAIQTIPWVGSAAETALSSRVATLRRRRVLTFFDELAAGELVPSEATVESEDFLHCLCATVAYAINTNRREKIRMFARLLKRSFDAGGPADADQYEVLVKILDDLSFNEIRALETLHDFQDEPREPHDNDLKWTLRLWPAFQDRLWDELGVPRAETSDFLNGIARTGCYREFQGYMDYTGGLGQLTPVYDRLRAYIEQEQD